MLIPSNFICNSHQKYHVSFAPPSGTSGLKTKGKSGAFVVNPGWKTKDNSSSGSVIKKGSENQENSRYGFTLYVNNNNFLPQAFLKF